MKCNNTLCKRHLENGECVKLVGKECKYEQAKELIEDLVDKIPSSHSDYYKDVIERARQFLKE